MSGFGRGAAWDQEVQQLAEGVRKALQQLRSYLASTTVQRGA